MAGRGGLIAQLSEPDRDRFLATGRDRTFAAGEVLMTQGAPSDHVALLLDGAVRVVAATREGDEVTVSVRIAGDLLGTLGVLTTPVAPRAATVSALGPVRARVIDAGTFRDLLHRHPTIAVHLLADVAREWRESSERQLEFGAYDADQRLARLIVGLLRADGHAGPAPAPVGIPLSQADLAGMIGASRESVARILARFRAEGLLETHRRAIHVRDVEGLEERAGLQ